MILAKAVVTDDKLEELLDQGNYGAIFNGDVSLNQFLICKATYIYYKNKLWLQLVLLKFLYVFESVLR